jgi:hypothetical protein
MGVEPFHLAKQAAVHHAVHAERQPLTQLLPVHGEADLHCRLEVLPLRHKGTERAAGELMDLQCADDAPFVGEPAGGHRIHGLEAGQQRSGALGRQVILKLLPQRRICSGEFQDVQRRAHVQPGTPGEDGAFAACVDVRDGGPCLLLEPGDAGFLGHIQDVQEMVPHSPAFGQGDFRRADVHAAVELHGIGVDDFAVQFECQADGKV